MNIMRFTLTKLFILGIILFLLSSCGTQHKTEVQISTKASAEGPFFAGPNSLIAEYQVDFSSIKGLENISKDQIKEIKINEITVTLNESNEFNFDAFTSASLQLVSSNTGMQAIAIKNPIESNKKESMLDVSNEVDLVEYFKNDKFSLVLDLDFIEDSYEEEIEAIIDLKLTIKHN